MAGSLLGFKFKLGVILLPLILVGAILRLFAKDKARSAGYALAGFGLVAITARQTADLSSIRQSLVSVIIEIQSRMISGDWKDIVECSRQLELDISEQVEPMRDIIAGSVASGRLGIPAATDCLESIRWLDGVSHHIARISLHLKQAVLASGK